MWNNYIHNNYTTNNLKLTSVQWKITPFIYLLHVFHLPRLAINWLLYRRKQSLMGDMSKYLHRMTYGVAKIRGRLPYQCTCSKLPVISGVRVAQLLSWLCTFFVRIIFVIPYSLLLLLCVYFPYLLVVFILLLYEFCNFVLIKRNLPRS